MPATISLASYIVRARGYERHQDGEFLNNFAGGHDLLEIMRSYLGELQENLGRDDNDRLLFKARPVDYDAERRLITGQIERGFYGQRTNIIDSDTGDLVHRKEMTHADMRPFYFLVYFPAGETVGFVLVQRYRTEGISDHFSRGFREYFSQCRLGAELKLEPVVLADVFRQYIDHGDIAEMVFIRHTRRGDRADQVDQQADERQFNLELIAKPVKRGHFLPFKREIQEFLDDQRPARGLVELVYDGFDPDTIKVKTRYRGRTRLVDVTNRKAMRAFTDITHQVEDGPDGHPTFASLDAAAKEHLGDLLFARGMANPFE